MNTVSDPIERLRLANPVPPGALRDAAAERARHLLVRLRANEVATPTISARTPRRTLVAAVAVATAGILAAAAYAGYTLTQTATQFETFGCYKTDSLNADTAVLGSGITSPVATCAATYASAFPDAQPPTNFAACVLPSGSIGVFPADTTSDTCKSLGLSNLAQAPTTQKQMKQFANLKHTLAATFSGSTCVSYRQARTGVRAALKANGLSKWTIQEGEGANGEGFSSRRPCAGLAYDTAQQTVVLVPEEAH